MKEVFLLPTKIEALFQPSPKVSEKASLSTKEDQTFRDYLEQAKSPPNSPPTNGVDRQSPTIHEKGRKHLPESKQPEASVETEEKPLDPPTESQDDQQVGTQAAAVETTPLVGVQSPFLSVPDLVLPNDVSLQDCAVEGVAQVGGEAGKNLLPSTDLLLETSMTFEKVAPKASQSLAEPRVLVDGSQVKDQSSLPMQEVELGDQTASVFKTSLKTVLQSTPEAEGEHVHPSAMGGKESSPSTATQPPQTVGEKGISAVLKASEQGDQKTLGVQRYLKEVEGQQSSAPEATKVGVTQASGPPIHAATSKSIEPARLAEAHRPEIVQQVARELELFSKSGQNSIRFQLYPEQLGRIDVRLISKGEGVQIVIRADNASTASLLEKDLGTLRESLIQAGVNLSGLSVGNGQAQNQSNLSQSEFRLSSEHATKFANFSDKEGTSSEQIVKRWRDSSSTLDYRV